LKHTFITISSIAIVASAMVPVGAVAQTALPAAVQADRATLEQDGTSLHSAFTQLKADKDAGNSAAAEADRTAVQLARMQVHSDFGKLHQDAQGLLQPDQTSLMTALTQLHSDQVAGNTSAVQADQAAVESAKSQLKADHTAIYGDLGTGSSKHHRHGQS
jgi:hypothetical protein